MSSYLAWDPKERPARAEMEAAAQSAMKHLGMEHARALFAAHSDTAHWHLHLVISRIDPLTGKAFPDSFDTLALSAWALQWERAHGGVRCEARLDREKQRVEHDPEKVLVAYFGRRETFTAFDLNRELTKAIPVRETRHAFIGAVLARTEMVRLADPENGQVMRYTIRQTLAAEQLASVAAERLAADTRHQISKRVLRGVADRLRADGRVLRDDQVLAWRHATGPAGLAVIAGKAGTGKSFAMSAIADAYQAESYAVQSLAPTNKVVAALRRDGLEAATLHSMLGRLDRGQAAWTSRTVVMVDEAGMVSTRMMARLLAHAEHAGAKVILIGDDKQLASMERGGMFGYLAAQYGAGSLDEITRQYGAEQRELAQRASRYDFQAALSGLDAQAGIVRVDTAEDRAAKAAELWERRTAAAPDRSLFVITVSNVDAQAVNLAIRDIRRRRGDLGPDHLLPTADGLQAFAEGDRILFSGTAGTREGRTAGLINANAGVITSITGLRVSVALDGAKPGEVVSFTVGPDREAGAFDTIRHGYAGTIYKAQGATYDHAIVVDHPMMRASSGYVALTRHRENVTVVTSAAMRPGFASWMAAEGGIAELTSAQRASAEASFEKWRIRTDPQVGGTLGFEAYVAYVQKQEASRQTEWDLVADMAKRWAQVEDRRAASRFDPVGYQAPDLRRMTPAEVRAAVGDEPLLPNEPERGREASRTLQTAQDIQDQERPVRTSKEAVMAKELPTEEMLREQAWQEARRLRELGEQEQRAHAFRLAKEFEAEAAKLDLDKKRAEEDGKERDGDIGDAGARYAIALGENYNVRDPYASLARSAMSESAMFHRGQERMRHEMAQENNPERRRIIELRMRIEGCEYMAITSDRLAGISVAITGRADSEQAVIDRNRAEEFRSLAQEMRTERKVLIEAGLDKKEPAREPAAVDLTVPDSPHVSAAAVAVEVQGDTAASARASLKVLNPATGVEVLLVDFAVIAQPLAGRLDWRRISGPVDAGLIA